MIRMVIGYDPREAIAYHVFCQSVLELASKPVSFTPLATSTLNGYHEAHKDGSNDFIYSRFLTPWLMSYQGWAIYADGDMVCNCDISELFSLRDDSKAVQVVKHNYKTKARIKYLGNKNEDYPRKNWSSLILWNCGHPANKVVTRDLILNKDGAFLHRFSWLADHLIGGLPKEWNWLASEYENNPSAKVIHYTLGTPCFRSFRNSPMSDVWHKAYDRATYCLEKN